MTDSTFNDAQGSGEPVAWRVKNDHGHWYVTQHKDLADTWRDFEGYEVQDLYAAKPPAAPVETRLTPNMEDLGAALDLIMSAPCEDQHTAAASIAGNIGMVLVNEPPHPDCPHERSSAGSTSGLAPCPFCGNEPKVREPFGVVRSGYQIACISDDCFGPHTTAHHLDDCIRQWNTRAVPQGARK